MDKHFHRTFTKCPVCELREMLAKILGKPELMLGSGEDRFFEQLANVLKDKGLAREEWHFHLDMKQGVVVDKMKEAAIPIGSEVPGFGFMTDICINCGCLYATDLTRNDVKKSVDVSHKIPPQRGGGPPRIPFSTS